MKPDLSIPVVQQVRTEPDEMEKRISEEAEELRNHVDKLAFNPVWGMLKAPRRTLSEVYRLDYPLVWVFVLICVSGVSQSLNNYIYIPEKSGLMHLAMTLGAGALSGVIYSLVSVFLLTYSGRLLGGKGTFKTVLTAWGWSCAPSVLIALIWGLRFAIVGPDYFTLGDDALYRAPILDRILLYSVFAQVGLILWQVGLTVVAVSESHQLSKRRTLLAFLLAIFIAGLLAALLATILNL